MGDCRNILLAMGVDIMVTKRRRHTRRRRRVSKPESERALRDAIARAKRTSELTEFVPLTFLQPQAGDTFFSFIGRSLSEIALGSIKYRWKEVAPLSYLINRTVYDIAPQRSVEDGPVLNLIALGTGLYGLSCVLEKR